jgi:hypothetical protein
MNASAAEDVATTADPIVRLHRVDSGGALNTLGQFSKLNPEWGLLTHARDIGREQAKRWLSRKGAAVGTRATLRL